MRTPILAVVALVFGLAAAYGTWHYISNKTPNDPEFDVVVVKESLKEDIQPNTELNAAMFEVKKMKQSQIGDPKENGLVINGTANRDMVALTSNKRRSKVKLARGKPILFDLQTVEQGAFGIQSQLAANEVAYVVQTNQYKGGSGLLRPGMKVDVVVSFKDPNSGDPKTAVMFEAIDVLAINVFENNPPENQALIPDRAVLRLSYDQMLRLSYFETSCNAQVSLNMRSSSTKDNVLGKTFDPKTERLFAPKKEEQRIEGAQGQAGSNNQGQQQGTAEQPSQPVGPDSELVDLGITFYDGNSAKHESYMVKRDKAPSKKPVSTPPAPGIDSDKKPLTIPGVGSEPEKKDDTKKKDDVKGGEAPKGSGGK